MHILFKAMFFIGSGLCFFSVFLDLYSFCVVSHAGSVISTWNYSMVFGWEGVNSQYRPPNLGLSFEFLVFYLGVLMGAGVLNIVKNIERTKDLSSFMIYAYVNIFVLLLIGFMVVIFPCFYLLQHELYFPFVMIYDEMEEITIIYTMGIGYILTMFSFVMVFPYVILYYQSVRKFHITQPSHSDRIRAILEKENEEVDLDAFIAEEEIRRSEQKTQERKEMYFRSYMLREGGM